MNEEEIILAYYEPENFGPIYWDYFHTFFMTRAEELALNKVNNWIHLFREWIPCEECRHHFWAIHIDHPFNEERYIKWCLEYSIHLHNIVNERLGKPEYTIEDFFTSFEQYDSRPDERKKR